jgi:DNA-binding SARP family transcriptional activator
MLCLKTLGGLGIERGDQPLPSTGPRRRLLALLALIAGHEPPGISRDKLLAYLWPESDIRHARNSLKQALYSVRQSLGIPLVINCAGGVLRLNRRLIEIDTWQFEATLALGEEAKAVSIYRGPYLDGFYVAGLDELERWMEAERERLARRYSDALRVLAERAEADSDTLAAAIWWRRLTAADPLCSTAALGLMRALATAGDPTAAREHARAHAAYVRAELGGPVAEAVVAFANRLRSEPVPDEPGSSTPRAPVSLAAQAIDPVPDRRSTTKVAAVSRSPAGVHLRPVPRPVWLAVASLWIIALLLVAFDRPARASRLVDAPAAAPPAGVPTESGAAEEEQKSVVAGHELELPGW